MSIEFSRVLDQIPPSGIRKFFDLVIGSKDIISLGVGEPDFVTPWGIREEAIATLEQGATSYTANAGLLECREETVSYLKERFNLTYDAKTETMLTVGVSEGVDITMRALLNAGDEVIIPEPGYVCYHPLVTLAGGIPITLDTSGNHFIPDPKELEKLITPRTKALVLCSPNNPTGVVIPKETLEAIAALSKKYQFWVITDEIYAELNYEGYTSYASIPGVKDRTILLSGFSKAFAMTGWRLGYLCGPEALVSRTLKIHQYSALCAPIIAQYAAIEALKHNLKAVEEMRKSYLLRRNFFVKRLNDAGLPTPMPSGAFYTFSSIKHTGLSSEEFALNLLKKERVAVVPGNAFGACAEGYIRCCYATDMEKLKEAVLRIKRFIKGLQ
ncbi:MAG: aminotransferase class I/II-fold pyridoxal phosphate-dependent enzyme [Candidatus Margulisbacteria bacterium]|nr:aminotransferase class I/II-fold pyridoxal phosphate-dependent enzyme [Candidatus Margulisiibacteriota bacterium]